MYYGRLNSFTPDSASVCKISDECQSQHYVDRETGYPSASSLTSSKVSKLHLTTRIPNPYFKSFHKAALCDPVSAKPTIHPDPVPPSHRSSTVTCHPWPVRLSLDEYIGLSSRYSVGISALSLKSSLVNVATNSPPATAQPYERLRNLPNP